MECQICFEFFDSTGFIPKILNKCGHSFCQICLERMINKHLNIQCPICRTVTRVTKKEVLPTNYALIQVLDKTCSDNQTKNLLEKYKYFNPKRYASVSPVIIRNSEPRRLTLKKIINEDFVYVEEYENNNQNSIFSFETKRCRRYSFNYNSIFSYFLNEYSYCLFLFRKSSWCKHNFSCWEYAMRQIVLAVGVGFIAKLPLNKILKYFISNEDVLSKSTLLGQITIGGLMVLPGILKCVISYYIDLYLKIKYRKIFA